ncbi:hypothetical protein HE1_00921 [Holospora elegans E1]|uniref:Transposase DDE domain-containing protein n=1 Tax=Holospora elegans E1 TaxID=1427503 RepID=A0A023DYM5_9PROT|nr:hypothetical protein [Holospora elegans]GAJ46586.1 hypothetical protein HE1_00921 [Holospora elegans E1]
MRKRHSVVDRQGNLLHTRFIRPMTQVLGAEFLRKRCKKSYIKGSVADSGYRPPMDEFVRTLLNKTIAISKRISQGWAILAKALDCRKNICMAKSFSKGI